jgi:hypothetical protein
MRGGVDLVRTDVSEESVALILRVERISELGTALAVTETLLPTKLTRRHIPEGILHSHRRESLKSYNA